MTNANQDRAIAVGVFLFAGAAFLYAGQYRFEAGLFPRLVTGIAMVAAVAMFVRSFLSAASGEAPPLFTNWPLLLAGVGSTVLYVVAVRRLGYFTSSVIFVPAVAYMLGLRDYRPILVGTLVFVGLVYAVFGRIFQLPLPRETLFALPA